MKKIVLLVLLILALTSTVEGQRRISGAQRGNSSGSGDPLRLPTTGGGVGAAACTDANPVGNCTGFLTCQNFEGTGYDNSEGANWLVDFEGAETTGVINPDYTTTALRGSQSLREKDDANYGGYALHHFANEAGAVNAQYMFFRIRFTDLPSANSEVLQTYWGSNDLGTIEPHEMLTISSTGYLRIDFINNTYSDYTTTQIELNTTYYVWLYYSRNASYQSTGWIKISTSATIPETSEVTWTNQAYLTPNSKRGSNAAGFTTYHGNSYDYIVDQFLVKTTAIGSVCP